MNDMTVWDETLGPIAWLLCVNTEPSHTGNRAYCSQNEPQHGSWSLLSM